MDNFPLVPYSDTSDDDDEQQQSLVPYSDSSDDDEPTQQHRLVPYDSSDDEGELYDEREKDLIQTGGAAPERDSDLDELDEVYDNYLDDVEAHDEHPLEHFFTITATQHNISEARHTREEDVQLTFHNFEDSAHPYRLMEKIIEHLISRVTSKGDGRPSKIGWFKYLFRIC